VRTTSPKQARGSGLSTAHDHFTSQAKEKAGVEPAFDQSQPSSWN
jgi:hypothetical protein